jgi:hypothetical protein
MSVRAGGDVYEWTPVRDDAELAEICALEASSYPPDEAASAGTLAFRLAHAGELFRVLRRRGAAADGGGGVAGYICGTAAAGGTESLTHESMSAHDGGGRVVCVHSVVVRAAGGGRRFERALLLSKEALVPFYEAAGFARAGPSAVQHGADTWIEMRLELGGALV